MGEKPRSKNILFTKEIHFMSKETHVWKWKDGKNANFFGMQIIPKKSRAGYPNIRQNRFLSQKLSETSSLYNGKMEGL